MEYNIVAEDTNTNRIVDWVSTGTDVSMDTTVSLMPGNLYQLFVTAVDIAGNELDTTTVRSEIIQRLNTPTCYWFFQCSKCMGRQSIYRDGNCHRYRFTNNKRG